MTRGGRWLLVFLLALAAGIGAYYASRAWFAPEPVEKPAMPAVPAVPAVPAAVIPDRRPEITLADRDGMPRSLSEWNGRPQVINFWATWCAPCRREIPMLNQLATDGAHPDIALIGIAIDFREDVLTYLEKTPIDYTVLIGEQEGLDAARAFGVETLGLPFTAFTDSKGRIATIHVGELHRPEAEAVLKLMREVDSGTIDMAAARAEIREKLAEPAQSGG